MRRTPLRPMAWITRHGPWRGARSGLVCTDWSRSYNPAASAAVPQARSPAVTLTSRRARRNRIDGCQFPRVCNGFTKRRLAPFGCSPQRPNAVSRRSQRFGTQWKCPRVPARPACRGSKRVESSLRITPRLRPRGFRISTSTTARSPWSLTQRNWSANWSRPSPSARTSRPRRDRAGPWVSFCTSTPAALGVIRKISLHFSGAASTVRLGRFSRTFARPILHRLMADLCK